MIRGTDDQRARVADLAGRVYREPYPDPPYWQAKCGRGSSTTTSTGRLRSV